MLPRRVVETIYPWSSRAHQTRTGVWKPMTHTGRPTALQGRQGNNSQAHSIHLMNRPVPKLTEGTPPCTCHEEVHCPWRAAQSSLHSFRPAGAKERRTNWGHGQGPLSPAFPSPLYSQQMFTNDSLLPPTTLTFQRQGSKSTWASPKTQGRFQPRGPSPLVSRGSLQLSPQ